MDIKNVNSAADSVCELMGLLSNRNRLMILCELAEGEKSVGELASGIGLRDSAISQQLAILRREKIVRARNQGQTRFYRIVRDDVAKVLKALYETYCDRSVQQPCKEMVI